MKQFNLQEYLAHPERKVITREGKKVRIICTDAKSIYPVIGLVDEGICGERFVSCQKNGRESNDIFESKADLFFAEKNELRHEGWINLPALTPEEQGDLPHPFQIPVFETEAKARKAREEVERCRLSISDYPHYILVKIEWEDEL